MKKRAHKVLGIEKNEANCTHNVVDPVGTVKRFELTWASLSGPQQGLIEGHAKRRMGEASPA